MDASGLVQKWKECPSWLLNENFQLMPSEITIIIWFNFQANKEGLVFLRNAKIAEKKESKE